MVLPSLSCLRLELRPAELEDLDFFTELNGDAQVMAHIPSGPVSRSETETEWRSRLGRRSDPEHGLGYWVGRLDGEPVGWWGLGFTPSLPGTGELGFRLKNEYWRRGLGKEGARAMVDHGLSTLALSAIWAGVAAGNTASRMTLTSLGMQPVAEAVPGFLTYEIRQDHEVREP